MRNNLTVSSSPHIHSDFSTAGIMLDVIIALIPTAVYGTIIFGWKAALIIAATGDRSLKGLPFEYRDTVRAIIFRQMLLALIK